MRTNPNLGLNLRMTEPVAAIAAAQIKKGPSIVQRRVALAEEITAMFDGIDFVAPPRVREDCDHVYYLWAGKTLGDQAGEKRAAFLAGLSARGVPFRTGYSPPLHRIFDPPDREADFPVARHLEDRSLFCFEICAFDPKAHHLTRMKKIIHEEAQKVEKRFSRDALHL